MIEFLPVIAPGLDIAEFMAALEQSIETATARLNDEAIARDPSLAARLATNDAAVAA